MLTEISIFCWATIIASATAIAFAIAGRFGTSLICFGVALLATLGCVIVPLA